MYIIIFPFRLPLQYFPTNTYTFFCYCFLLFHTSHHQKFVKYIFIIEKFSDSQPRPEGMITYKSCVYYLYICALNTNHKFSPTLFTANFLLFIFTSLLSIIPSYSNISSREKNNFLRELNITELYMSVEKKGLLYCCMYIKL